MHQGALNELISEEFPPRANEPHPTVRSPISDFTEPDGRQRGWDESDVSLALEEFIVIEPSKPVQSHTAGTRILLPAALPMDSRAAQSLGRLLKFRWKEDALGGMGSPLGRDALFSSL